MDLAAALSAYAALTSLHLLLTYLFGVRASQYLTMAVIMLVSLGPTILALLDIRVDLSFFAERSKPDDGGLAAHGWHRRLSVFLLALSEVFSAQGAVTGLDFADERAAPAKAISSLRSGRRLGPWPGLAPPARAGAARLLSIDDHAPVNAPSFPSVSQPPPRG